MGWKNWEVDLTLLRYCGEWYHTTDDMRQGRTLMQYFDSVVEGEYGIAEVTDSMPDPSTFS